MPNPTLVIASLSDKEITDSISKLVQTVEKGTQEMTKTFDSAVDGMKRKLQELGNVTFSFAESSNGGAAKMAEKVKNVTSSVQELNMTYDKMQSVINNIVSGKDGMKKMFNESELQSYMALLRNLQAEYIRVNTEQGGGVLSDKIKADIQSLEQIIAKYQEILNNLNYVKSRQGTIDVSKWVQDLGAVDDRYKKLTRWYTVLEKEDQRRIANEEKANQKRLAELEKEQQARNKMIESARKAEEKYQNAVLRTEFSKVMDMPTNNVDQMRNKLERLQTILANIRELGILSPSQIAKAETEISNLRGSIQQIERLEQERIAAEKKFLVEQAKEVEQTQTLEGRVKSLTQAVKEYFAANEGEKVYDNVVYGKNLRIFPESSKFAEGLTIEQQITKALTEEKAARDSVSQSAQQQGAATEKVVNSQKEEQETIKKSFREYDSLREAIAYVLKTKSENVRLYGVETSSANALSNKLKELRSVYNQLGTDDRHSQRGKELIFLMQRIERQAQKTRNELSRPTNLENALGLSEKTLDDISYKLRQLSAYKMGLNITDPKALEEMKQVDAKASELKKKYDDLMVKNKSLIESNKALGRSWNYMKNRLAFYLTVGATTQFIKQLIEVRSQYELLDRSIGILIDDARKGSAMFRELSEMALKSPFTLIELGSATKQLVAYNIATEDVVDTTRRLADMAAAVGLPIERLTYALGQVKAYGYLNSRDARIFLNAGIPIVQMLADMYNKERDLDEQMITAGQVREMMQKRLVSYADVMKVVNAATDEGGRFFNFQEKAADTLKVRLANLNLAWNNLLNDIGKSEQGTIQMGIKGLTTLFRHWREFYRILMSSVAAFGAYKTGALLASLATSQLAKSVFTAGTATKGLSVAIKSIPFAGWLSVIASIISYMFIFNDSLGDVGRKLQEITEDLDGFSKKMSDMYVKALSSDKLSEQLEEIKQMIHTFENEFGVTIPVNLEDVNEGNIKDKIKEVKDRIDSYLAFTAVFTKTGAENERLKESFDEFGANANSVLNLITTNISLVKQGLIETGKTAKEVEILDKKEGESTVEYLQRIISLYEEIGLLGKKKTMPYIGLNPFKTSEDNTEILAKRQEEALTKLGIKNKEIFRNMMENAWDYYASLSTAQYQFERFAKDLGSKMEINKIVDEKERTLKVEAAIDKYAAQNSLNQTATELMKYLANQKYDVKIKVGVDPNAKKNTESELQEWQKKLQAEADKNKIKLTIAFTTEQTELSYAQEALTKYKEGLENLATQKRKKSAGTATQEDVDNATDAVKKLREQARLAGADLSSVEKGASKAQKAAETELQKALKEELKLIDEVRSQYKKLTDAGVSRAVAMKTVTEQFSDSIKHINAVLGKNGLPKFNIKSFAGTDNPHEMMVMLKKQIDAAKNVKNIKPEEINELEIKYSKIKVDAEAYDATKIKKGLDNELGRLKDEYELAVELDANPELGNMFADMFDIDLDTLPRTAKEYADRYTKSLNKYFNQMGANIELPNMLNLTRNDMEAFAEQLGTGELQQAYFDLIQKGYESTQAARKKEATDAIREYDKLLQKYAEYQYSLTRIAKEANEERKALVVRYGTDEQKEQARKIASKIEFSEDPSEIAELEKQLKSIVDKVAEGNNVVLQIGVAIDRKQAQESANEAFEEFKKNPIWTTAIGDLEGMTHKALRLLINDLEDFKKANSNLSPKQIKEIEKTITKLRKQARKNNPFSVIADAMSDAKERADEFQPRIDEIEEEIKNLSNSMDSSNFKANSEKIKGLSEELKKLKDLQSEEGEIDWRKITEGINGALQSAKQAIGYFTDMMDALGGEKGSLASKRTKEILGVLEKAVGGAMLGAQTGSVWGVAIGAIVGGLSAAVTTWADEWSGNASITRAMNASVKAAKDLENTYKRLTYVSEEFYGATSIASKEAAKNVNILELAELQRQLRLEESRDSKDRDQDKINEIRSQIIDLEHEVANATKQTVSELLGISSHADFFEGLISDMISAFKNGEDAMEVFENKWAEMIDSMVTKMILGQVLQQWIKSLESGAESIVSKYTSDYATQIADLESKMESVESMSNRDFMEYLEKNEPELYRQYFARWGVNPDELDWVHKNELWMMFGEDFRNQYLEMLKNSVDSYTDEQARASLDATSELMDYYEQAGEEFKEKYLDAIVDKISENYTFGEGAESKLSALQQGIQGVTEDTAGALEAMMNGMSQQVYLHTDLLTQIRDAVYNITGGDLEMGIQAQMLFQLQQSYTVQMAIQNILEGAVSPNGQSFRVELVS